MPSSTISSTIDPEPDDDQAAALPPRWTAEHVALRLVEAFRTLDRMPRPKGPRAAGNHWPRHSLEWADQVAQAELPEAERRDRDARRNRLACQPNGTEIARMDRALDWLRRLRGYNPDLALTMSLWALRTARRRSVRAICQEMGWKASTFYYQRSQALDHLAATLNGDGVSVF